VSLLDPVNRVGFKALVGEVGWWEAFQVGAKVEAARLRGEPFEDLEAPASRAEKMSREQMAPAVLMYRELRGRYEQSRAYEIAEAVVTASAVAFLGRTVGRLRREELIELNEEERRAFVTGKGEQFFNAEVEWEAIEAERVAFTVTRCHFVELCERLGVPELAPVFCAGDGEFFGGVEEDVALERETTIAKGGDVCPFRIGLG